MQKPLYTALVLATAAVATSALANPYKEMYSFGDSLFDNGQFNGMRFTNRVGPDYLTSDYGPVAPSLVADNLRVPEGAPSRDGGTNYAVAGNTTTETLLSVNAPTTYQAPYALDRPGSGLNPNFNSLFYNLELRDKSLQRSALYILDGGGNDIAGGQVFDEETAAAAAGNMVEAANALKNRGAKYVVIANVPDVGLVPGGVSFAEFASEQAAAINSQIQLQVGSSNILIFDAFTFIREVAADPMAYGIPLSSSEISLSCFSADTGTCAGGNPDAKLSGSNPDPDQFYFNDFLHPTTIGQQIAADYISALLQAPGEISLLPQMGIDDMQSQWRAAQPIMQTNRWKTTTPVGGYSVWGGANYNEDKHDTRYNSTGTNEATQYNVGVAFRPAQSWYIGAQVGRADNELDFGSSKSHYEMESLNVTLLGGFHSGPWFAEGAISYSDLDYDEMKRSFSLGTVLSRTESADTSGEVLGIKLKAGLNVVDPAETYRFGPTWGYDYMDSDVDGYEEKSGLATALRVDDMTTTSGIASAGIFGDMQLDFCDCELYSELTYRAYLDNDDTNPRIGMVSVPGNSAKLPGYEQDEDSVRWDAGMAATIGRSIELNIGGGYTDADNGEAFWFGGEVIYTF